MKVLSIIIPVFKEEAYISKLLNHISRTCSNAISYEVIVVDFNHSTRVESDNVIYLNSPKKGRANQMNFGASKANAEILYFLHADSYPPKNFDSLIVQELKHKSDFGCFRMQFDKKHIFLGFFAWFTRFKSNWCRGGDQSLFVRKKLFLDHNGFDSSLIIMEDLEIIKRFKKVARFSVIKDLPIVTSSRKYERNGIYKLQLVFSFLHLQYRLGRSQAKMIRFYERFIVSN